MPHTLHMLKDGKLVNVTPIVGNISWRSSKDELGQQLTFEVAYNDAPFIPKDPIEIGAMMILRGVSGAEVLRAIVIEQGRTGRGAKSYSCLDAAFYLNQSQAIYQFNKQAADKALRRIAQDAGVPIGTIAPMATRIKEVYVNQTPSDIMKEILAKVHKDQGRTHRMEMRQGKLHIERQRDLLVQATFNLANNIQNIPVNRAIGAPSRKLSIENMRNRVVIVKGEKRVMTLSDQPKINEYGLLQHIEQADEDATAAQMRRLARTTLEELSRVFEETSVTLLGDDRVRAGRLIDLTEPVTGISGRYMISSVDHRVNGRYHVMDVDLERWTG